MESMKKHVQKSTKKGLKQQSNEKVQCNNEQRTT